MEFVTLTDLEGRRAKAELLSAEGGQQRLRLEDGQTLSLPEDTLVKQQSGDYYLLLKLTELDELADGSRESGSTGDDAEDDIVVPVAEEQITVHKRQVEGATIRITKQVHEETQTVEETLLGEEVHVERVKIDRVVEAAEPIRSEGDTTIIPLYEEVLVIEKRLVLAEELRITKKQTETLEPQRVTLRRERATVERLNPDGEVISDVEG